MIANAIVRNRALIAFFAGALSATGFAPLNLWPITLACLSTLVWLINGADNTRRAATFAWIFGVGHFTFGNSWIATAFTHQSAMPAWIGWVAIVLLSGYLAIFPALAAIISRTLADNRNWASVLTIAAAWIFTEWLRSWAFTGFAWNPIGVIWIDSWLGLTSRWVGTYGLSGITMLLAAFIAKLTHDGIIHRTARHRAISLRPALPALCGLAALFLALAASFHWIGTAQQGNGPRVTVVQPNIGQDDKHDPLMDLVNFQKLARFSTPDGKRPRLLLWPEAAIPDYLEGGYPARYYQDNIGGSALISRQRLASLLAPQDLLATGAVKLEISQGQAVGARNGVAVLDANATLQDYYAKAHLVPFGEYLPLRALLEPIGISRLVPGSLDFWPGPGPQSVDLGIHGKMGLQICYEIIFSGRIIDRNNRPDYLFNPSNDAWFGNSGPPQHLAQARLRAIEEAMPIIRATPTGISAIIDGRGRIVKSIPQGTAGAITLNMPLADRPGLFATYGNRVPLLLSLLLAICAVAIRKWRV